MKLFIELPTWLGDAVMATPAIENVVKTYPNAHITIFGSPVAVAVFKYHPHVDRIIKDNSRNARLRWLYLYKTARSMGAYDIALSFRDTMASRLFMKSIRSQCKENYRQDKKKTMHLVMRYNDFVNASIKIKKPPGRLKIYTKKQYAAFDKPTIGINPGASYGSAKCWYPEKFAAVAMDLSKDYDVVIFGGPDDIDMAYDIEKYLLKHKIINYHNTAGKTSIEELINKISELHLLITGDSGPMHLAAAFSVPTVAIFGPTKDQETSQWMNKRGAIVKKNLDCQPCMRRTCRLKHHNCMKQIEPSQVIKTGHLLLKETSKNLNGMGVWGKGHERL